MGDIYAFGSENELIPGKATANQVIERKSSEVGVGTQRKGLVDVTNLEPNGKLLHPNNNTVLIPAGAKEYMEQLHKENLELKKLIADRNKIIELTGTELKNLRVTLQKMHQQNWQLAQANSHMLAELNNGKDRLKAMQHELGCLKCVVAVKSKDIPMQEAKVKEEGDSSSLAADNRETKHSDTKNRRLSRRASSSTFTAKDAAAAATEKRETKRSCKRRKSTRLSSKPEDPGSTEDLFEVDEAKFSVGSQCSGDTKVSHSLTTSEGDKSRDSTMKEENSFVGSLPSELRRSSIGGRPMRRAAEKVNNYKEPPLNVKMRRTS